MEKPQYIDWLVEESGVVIKDLIPLKCYKIDYKCDEGILDDWALHIRRNYIDDVELEEDAEDNEMTIGSWIPFVLKAFDCRSRGRAFVYLPLMMEATSAGVAILLRKRFFGLGAFRIVPSLLLEAYTWT